MHPNTCGDIFMVQEIATISRIFTVFLRIQIPTHYCVQVSFISNSSTFIKYIFNNILLSELLPNKKLLSIYLIIVGERFIKASSPDIYSFTLIQQNHSFDKLFSPSQNTQYFPITIEEIWHFFHFLALTLTLRVCTSLNNTQKNIRFDSFHRANFWHGYQMFLASLSSNSSCNPLSPFFGKQYTSGL